MSGPPSPPPRRAGTRKRAPPPAADLLAKEEGRVDGGGGGNPADLELVGVLGAQARGSAEQQNPHHRGYPHGKDSSRTGESDPQNTEFSRKTRYPFGLSL